MKSIEIKLSSGAVVQVQVWASHTFRVRMSRTGQFRDVTLQRYGIVRPPEGPVEFVREDGDGHVVLRTPLAALTVSCASGNVSLADAEGAVLCTDAEAPACEARGGFDVRKALADDERLYGLGDASREGLRRRGQKVRMWVQNVKCYVPIPTLLSSRGWGLFLNTTWRHFFDLGRAQHDRLRFYAHQGELDYFLFCGRDLGELVDRATQLTGRPALLPLWAYGLTFVCNQQANAREMLEDGRNFRQEGMPCDGLGLEPGWMEKHYDYSTEKRWHPERFYVPPWSAVGPHTFMSAAKRMGFKTSLWLCCDYDLTFEEERRALCAAPTSKMEAVDLARDPDDFEQDQHAHRPVMMDQLTKRDEPWFEHLKKFVDQGARAFKLDGAVQVNEHPDRAWGNGMTDEECHNLYPAILNKQMSLGFRAHTGLRPLIYSSGGYAGIQQYSATWAGDTGGGPKPLISILNHGLTGHSNASCDMDVFTPAGIHFGFLLPWSQLCSWAYWRHPWYLDDRLKAMFRFYARLRYRLLPYIYSLAHVAHIMGTPILRAMPLAFPGDPRGDDLSNQYMLGDALLVAAFTHQVYLPRGEWVDFWSGERFSGPMDLNCRVPEDRGGPLFIRAGGILPCWPEMDFVGQKPVNGIALHLYPGGSSAFRMYEDDGETFAFESGAVAITDISCASDEKSLELTVRPRVGEYQGMPAKRHHRVIIHGRPEPREVTVNDQPVGIRHDTTGPWYIRADEDPMRKAASIVRCRWA